MGRHARHITAAAALAGVTLLGPISNAGAEAAGPAGEAARTSPNVSGPESPTAGVDAHLDRHCEVGEFCLYYNSSSLGYGSFADFWHADANLRNNRFLTSGAGSGRIVANDAAAYYNRDPYCTAHVYTGINYTGRHGWIPPGRFGDFSTNFKNNVESFRWVC